MLLQTLKYIISTALVVIACSTYGQVTNNSNQQQSQEDEEPRPKPVDTVKHSYIPTGIRVGGDVITLAKSHFSNHFTGWEVNADVDFYRYYLAVDYGNWARNEKITNGDYSNDGHYFRIGGDINFLLKDPDKNMFFLGFRYGRSTFNEYVAYSYVDSTTQAVVGRVASSAGVKGHWLEITTGLRVKIIGGFWMGYTARVKFAPGTKGANPDLKVFDIPGYGLAEKTTWWGINYQLFWRFPLRKAK